MAREYIEISRDFALAVMLLGGLSGVLCLAFVECVDCLKLKHKVENRIATISAISSLVFFFIALCPLLFCDFGQYEDFPYLYHERINLEHFYSPELNGNEKTNEEIMKEIFQSITSKCQDEETEGKRLESLMYFVTVRGAEELPELQNVINEIAPGAKEVRSEVTSIEKLESRGYLINWTSIIIEEDGTERKKQLSAAVVFVRSFKASDINPFALYFDSFTMIEKNILGCNIK